jgi:methylmalonyl-CoA/ethylmalonyl-CoA epimerase
LILQKMKQSDFSMSIDHVAIAVVDLQQAIRWYQDNLGFQLIQQRLTQGSSTANFSAVMKSGTAVVVLIQGTTPQSQVSRFIDEFGSGVQHLALSVSNLETALERLSSGAPDIEPLEGDGIRQVFLRRDPGSGVRVELIERKGGNFNDRSVENLFRAFEDTPQAVAKLLRSLADNSVLSANFSTRLLEILAQTRTFPDRLKAGVSPGWRLCHKTGTSETYKGLTTASHDVGVLTAPDGEMIAVVVLIGNSRARAEDRATMTADVARAVISSYR